ncbi:MAG TPA: hypothetical protein VLE48_01180 [Terriglobales bacterium]|nr:hypothetical protein [Terriglobales bacterium]
MHTTTSRVVILAAAFVVLFTVAQPFLPAPAAETAHALDPSASLNKADDPRVLYLFSQVEMALGDVESAVRLADRASKAERNRTQETPQPAKGTTPCNSQSHNLRASIPPIPLGLSLL